MNDIRILYASIRFQHIQAYLLSKGWKLTSDPFSTVASFKGPLHESGEHYEVRLPASDSSQRIADKVQRLLICLNEIEDRQPFEIATDILSSWEHKNDDDMATGTEINSRGEGQATAAQRQPAADGPTRKARIRLECCFAAPTNLLWKPTGIELVLENNDLIELEYDVRLKLPPRIQMSDGTVTIDSQADHSARLFFSVVELSREVTLRDIIREVTGVKNPDGAAHAQELPDSLKEAVSRSEFEEHEDEQAGDFRASAARSQAAMRQAAILVTALAPHLRSSENANPALLRVAARVLGRAMLSLELRSGWSRQFEHAIHESSLSKPIPLLHWLRVHAEGPHTSE